MSDGTFKLSNQALGAVMMALQESLLNKPITEQDLTNMAGE